MIFHHLNLWRRTPGEQSQVMVCFMHDSDCNSETGLTIDGSVAGSTDHSAAVDSLTDAHASAADQGRIARQLADYSVDWRPNRGSESIADLPFPSILDLDARLTEIMPAGGTELHRHSYEALFYVIAGAGYSTISVDAGDSERIEWKTGDLFATPRGTWHQHANSSSSELVRLLEITTAPLTQAWATHCIETRKTARRADAKLAVLP